MFTFDAAAHEYRLNGVRLPSVTQITQGLTNYDGIPAEILERKRLIGSATHLASEFYDNGILDESTVDPVCEGYFQAYKAFRRDHAAKIWCNEKRLFSERHGYAGTLDRVFEFCGGHKGFWMAGDFVQIDLKTVAQLQPATAVQMAGYQLMLPPLPVPRTRVKRVALQLKPNATYKLEPYIDPDDEQVFLASLRTFKWKEFHNV